MAIQLLVLQPMLSAVLVQVHVANPWKITLNVWRNWKKLLTPSKAFKNLTLALAGTLGVGNIIGVAIGLSVGGAGSVFWLVLSAIPAAAIKYAESALAVGGGFCGVGMMGAIESSFEKRGAFLGRIYAFFVLLLCFRFRFQSHFSF